MKKEKYKARAQRRSARAYTRDRETRKRRHLLTLLSKDVERKKRTEMKVKVEETTGGRDTAKNIIRNDRERNEKKQVQ